jgi:osmotically inducible protein OsmC
MSDALYSAHAHVIGGRQGTAKTDDGQLDLKLAFQKVLGGDGAGTNPEELFACGYGACFTSTLGFIARQEQVALGDHSVDCTVDLFKDEPTFKIGATLALNAPALDKAKAQELMEKAHQFCPYSKATRGNIDVKLVVV